MWILFESMQSTECDLNDQKMNLQMNLYLIYSLQKATRR